MQWSKGRTTWQSRLRESTLMVGLVGTLGWSGEIGLLSPHTLAQVVADPSVGTVVTPNETTYQITGGTTVGGRNLFHSFSRFDVPAGGIASFQNAPTIANIFARVTGGARSEINGLIQAGGTANLLLMNPSGILFGAGAQLNIGGSFVATTANAIQFSDRGSFSATASQVSQLLAVNPSAFLFNQIQAGAIENRSIAPAGTDLSGSSNLFGLRVPEGRSILFVGGNVNISGGGLFALGGRVELVGLAGPGSVGLTVDNGILKLNLPSNVNRADVTLTDGAYIATIGRGGGDIAFYARNINVLEGSNIEAGIGPSLLANKPAGDIYFNTTESATVSNSYIYNNVSNNAIGDSGKISFDTSSLSLVNGSQVYTLVLDGGKGNAGAIRVFAKGKISANGADPNGFPSGFFSIVNEGGEGNAGDITIQANSLEVTNRAQVASVTRGIGNAGNITLNVDKQVFLLNSIVISEVTEGSGVGSGGNINIATDSLVLRDGSALLADTENQGNAGNIFIDARGDVILDGLGPAAGNSNQTVRSQISSTVESGATGRGGNIEIKARSLSILDDGFISASTAGKGNAGNITLKIDGQTLLVNSLILSEVTEETGNGDGGNINITTGSLILRNGSALLADTENQGNAGNIFIDARGDVILDGLGPAALNPNQIVPSQISTTVESNAIGQGGSIEIKASALSILDGGFISSSTAGKGDARDIKIWTDTLTLRDGAQLRSSTTGASNAGNIFVNAKDSVVISGVGARGFRSGLFANTGRGSSGNAGNIVLQANSLSLSEQAEITSNSRGEGNAGNIKIQTNRQVTVKNSDITTSADRSSGGTISISAQGIRLFGDSDIRTNVEDGQGNGGDILLIADYILALNDSDILAFARDGKGGNITLDTTGFFGQNYRLAPPGTNPPTLDGNNRVDINASGAISGVITLPDTTFIQNSLTQLPRVLINTGELMASSCIVRRDRPTGSFFITGSGGLPERPGEAGMPAFPTGEVGNVEEGGGRSQKPGEMSGVRSHWSFENEESGGRLRRERSAERRQESEVRRQKAGDREGRPWRIGDPIVEPQGVYQLPNGKLVLSHECSTK